MLLRIREALNSRPIGRIERRNTSLETCTSFAPSSKCVVFCSTRVPMALESAESEQEIMRDNADNTHCERQMPCNEEDGELKLQCVVQIVVINYNR